MQRIAISIVVALTGCGRVGFDPSSSSSDGGGTSDAVGGSDATTTCGSDGSCPPSCVGGDDPDCVTTCGDGICVGNAGESCRMCGADCDTEENVCGNQTCGDGETSATCYTDCGPTPWPWEPEEADLVIQINQMRTTGFTCPGGGFTTAPALSPDPTLTAAARDFAWERAHHGGGGFNRCNGALIPGDSLSIIGGRTDNAMRMTTLMTGMAECNIVMNPGSSTIGVGIAADTNDMLILIYE